MSEEPSPFRPEDLAEFRRRLEEFRKNPAGGVPWEEVRRAARARWKTRPPEPGSPSDPGK